MSKIVQYAFASVFGSHKNMVNEEKMASLNKAEVLAKNEYWNKFFREKNTDNVTFLVLTDEHGDYITTQDRLDSGVADPARCELRRLTKLFDKKSDNKDE